MYVIIDRFLKFKNRKLLYYISVKHPAPYSQKRKHSKERNKIETGREGPPLETLKCVEYVFANKTWHLDQILLTIFFGFSSPFLI